MQSKRFWNVYKGECRIEIQKFCAENNICKDEFHFLNIYQWQDIYNKVIDRFVDKTKNYDAGLHWLNTNCRFRKDMEIQYSFNSQNQWGWVRKLPELVENPQDMVYLLIEDNWKAEKFWIAEGYLDSIAKILYEFSYDDIYIVDKKYRWMITSDHEECVLFVGDGFRMNEVEKLKTIFIRKYEPSYCEQTAKLFYDTVHSVNAKDYTEEQLNAWADGKVDLEKWNKSFLDHCSLVAIIGDQVVGFGDIDETGYLDRLYVHKDFQRYGIGGAICSSLEFHYGSGKTILTHASITARPFFEMRGYKVIKEQQAECNGILLTNYIMKKQKAAAQVLQYAYKDKDVNNVFDGLIDYMSRNKITLSNNQAAISVRVLADLKAGDTLTSESGNKIIIKGLYACGFETDLMSRGMTCVIIAEITQEDFSEFQILYFENLWNC